MGSRSAAFPAGHDAATARDSVLGYGGLAHGLECERRGPAGSHPAAPRPADQGSARIFPARERFSGTRNQNNPDRPQLYEALARLYRDKYNDHEHAAEFFDKAAGLPGAPSYAKRFAAYELSYCEGREKEAYGRLHALYALGESERLPTLIRLLKELEIKLAHSTGSANSGFDALTGDLSCASRFLATFTPIFEATEAVLADARERDCTHFICLGDVVGYNANPHECVEIVQKMECPVVKGNHDEQASLTESSRGFNALAEAAINWTRAHLTEEDKAMAPRVALSPAGSRFHHRPCDPRCAGTNGVTFLIISMPSPASPIRRRRFAFSGTPTCPGAFVRDDGVKRVKVDQLTIEDAKKYFINVGSVGQPRDGDWRAAYCIYHMDKSVVEQRRVKYDLATAQKKIIQAGLPRMLADRLELGR